MGRNASDLILVEELNILSPKSRMIHKARRYLGSRKVILQCSNLVLDLKSIHRTRDECNCNACMSVKY